MDPSASFGAIMQASVERRLQIITQHSTACHILFKRCASRGEMSELDGFVNIRVYREISQSMAKRAGWAFRQTRSSYPYDNSSGSMESVTTYHNDRSLSMRALCELNAWSSQEVRSVEDRPRIPPPVPLRITCLIPCLHLHRPFPCSRHWVPANRSPI